MAEGISAVARAWAPRKEGASNGREHDTGHHLGPMVFFSHSNGS